jgi:hypothetical protein
MGAFKSAVITKKGQSLMAKVVQGGTKLDFTQIKTSEKALSGDLASLTSIGTIKQAEKVASVVRQNLYNVKVSASFSNKGLTAGYYVRNIGLYAMDPTEGEILFSISVADESTATADWMPPYTGVSVSSLMVDLITAVSNASSVNVVVDPTANATVAQIMEVNERLTALDNSITTTREKLLSGSVAGGIKVNKVLGKSEQFTTTGKNLLQNVATSQIINGITFTVKEDGSIIANGTATDLASLTIDNISLPNGDYILSGCPKGGAWNTYSLQYRYGSQDYGNGLNLSVSDGELKNIRILVYTGVTLSNAVFKPMIRLASIADNTYEPYTGGIPSPNLAYPQTIKSVEVSKITAHGKNFFNVPQAKFTSNSTTITNKVITDTGATFTVDVSVGSTAHGVFTDGIIPTLTLGKQYTLSCEVKVSALGSFDYFSITNGSGKVQKFNSGEFTVGNFVRCSMTFEAKSSKFTFYFNCLAHKDEADFDVEIKNIQIEESAVATEFEPYKENSVTLSQSITLRGIGDVMDELTSEGVVRNVAELVLSGIDNEQYHVAEEYNSADCTAFYAVHQHEGVLPHAYEGCEAYCDKLLPLSLSDLQIGDNQGFMMESPYFNRIILRVPNSISNLEEWIAENPLTLVYPVATPIIEPLPVADQIALRSLVSYDGVTCLGTDSEVSPIIEAEYGTNKVGAHTLTGLLTAQRNELRLEEITSTVSALPQG